MDDVQTLVAPNLPQSKDGIIDVRTIADTIAVKALVYGDIREHDQFTAFFDDTPSSVQLVPPPPYPEYIYMYFPKDAFPNGTYKVNYTAQDEAGNISYSFSTEVTIINSAAFKLNKPVFPDAVRGKLYQSTIVDDGGARIQAQYEAMSLGDELEFHWNGLDEQDVAVPGVPFVSPLIRVEQTHMELGYVEVLIPKANVLALGRNGVGVADYSVTAGATSPFFGRQQTSLVARIIISWDRPSQLDVVYTQMAVSRDPAFKHLLPSNWVKVYGSPGAGLTASVSASGTIEGSVVAGSPRQITLDDQGHAYLQVFTSTNQEDKEIVLLSLYSPEFPAPLTYVMNFAPMSVGQAGIHAYGYTTGAAADGTMPCSIYLHADPKIQSVAMTVSGSALINGWTQQADIPVHLDGTATVNILNTKEEDVVLSIYINKSYRDNIYIYLEFKENLL